jgi:hypothetical protein
MKEIVFLLEEESARILLSGLFPRLVPEALGVRPRFIVFEGKQDLDGQLVRKLRGYLNPDAAFIVLRDQDRASCHEVKRALRERCQKAGRPGAVIRIACCELEAFYLGDLRAVEAAFGIRGLAARQKQARYRDPDAVQRPSAEMERITDRRYQKVAGSRAIAPHLDLETPRSRSFHHLVTAIRTTVEQMADATV